MVSGRGLRGTEAAPQQRNNPLREGQRAPGIDQQLEVRNSKSPGHRTSITPSVEGERGEGELCYAQLKFSQIFQLDTTFMKTTHLPQSILTKTKLYTVLLFLVLNTDVTDPVQQRKKSMTFVKVNGTEDLQNHIHSREEKEGEDGRKIATVNHQHFYPLVSITKLN